VRRSNLLIMIVGLLIAALIWETLDYRRKRTVYAEKIWMRQRLQSAVGLTDLAITSAARYLRHYSLSDLATPFQDYPASLDHFPAGFVFAPPDYSGIRSSVRYGKMKVESPVVKTQ
jgi:hypothetical protein